MLISVKGTYALRVLTDMVKHDGQNNYLCICDISSRLNISRKYLETIMTLLAKNGLIDSKRGASGGYKLIKKADQYNLLEIMEALEEDLSPISCLSDGCRDCSICPTFDTFKGLQDVIYEYLKSKTLQDLINPDLDC
ncbi:MAG: RrF2 family transcriptional regulator [Erysipelotrichaceae bacterium]